VIAAMHMPVSIRAMSISKLAVDLRIRKWRRCDVYVQHGLHRSHSNSQRGAARRYIGLRWTLPIGKEAAGS